ncbi:hypothetical protein [Serinicoccus kebangsaanensis]|uniref:hypothetical protein n=1 Tax=Serinicoccus kebangsaanensis TaxID=2602069 RepID=UPI00124DC444|nr:hypothetical protein [Serinicoccus kebangsaanensis]
MTSRTLRTLAIAGATGAAVVLASPATAVDESQLDGYDNVSCDVMAMPGTATATYIDESVHGPYLDGDNEWVALTLTSDDGAVEVEMPEYGQTYDSDGGAVIREITLCQGTAVEAADDDAAAQDDEDAEQAPAEEPSDAGAEAADDEAAEDEAAGPAVETGGPVREAGVSPLLIGGAVLAAAGAGAAAIGVRRRDLQRR